MRSTSSQNNTVSAYSSINAGKDTLSIVLVNRDMSNNQPVRISPVNTTPADSKVYCYQLFHLPETETFVSATQNALKHSETTVNNGTITLALPPLSVTALRIALQSTVGNQPVEETKIRLYPNPAQGYLIVDTSGLEGIIHLTISDMTGKIVKSSSLSVGYQKCTVV